MTTDSRRSFIKTMTTGAASASLLGILTPVRRAFATEMDRLKLTERNSTSFQQLRDDYMLDPGVTYLNHASIGTMPRAVFDARARYLELCESNPWLYMWGGAWEEPREEVRRKAARLLGGTVGEITFTHNTTEAFSLLANGLPLGAGDEVVFSSLNHDGASVAWFQAADERGFDVKRFEFPVLRTPSLSKDDILNLYDEQISSRTRVLVFPEIDNVVGIRHPMKALVDLAKSRGVEFVAADAAQTVGMLDVDIAATGIDIYATSPHKWLQAPKGLGLMYTRKEIQESLRAMWVTWGQNRWRGTSRIFEDYGTRNLAEVLALGDAIDFQARIDSGERERRLRELWQHTKQLATANQRTDWRSSHDWELSSSLYSVELHGSPIDQVSQRMFEEHGVVFRPFRTQELNSARLSPNIFTSEEEIERFFELATRG